MPAVSPLAQTTDPQGDEIIDAETTSFPNPANFTFLPDLYLVISRLSVLKSSSITGNSGIVAVQPLQASDATTIVAASGINPLTTTTSHESRVSDASVVSNKGGDVIEIKDLPAHIYSIRQALARAKEVVRGLPDVERTVEEQESEISALDQKIQAFNRRLEELSVLAGQSSRTLREQKDVIMTGIEK